MTVIFAGLTVCALLAGTVYWEERYAVGTRVAPKLLVPEATGTRTCGNEAATLDLSNTEQGYIMVRYHGDNHKVKLVVKKQGKKCIHDIPRERYGRYGAFPLTEGSGMYEAAVYENLQGTSYTKVCECCFEAEVADETLPFRYPNHYVGYSAESRVVEVADSLAVTADTDLDVIESVYEYVAKNVTYDDALAEALPAGYLPDVDEVLHTGKGICFDYAALMAAMLRSQGIPAKLVVGHLGDVKHAWVSVYTEEAGEIGGNIRFEGGWVDMDPTHAAAAGKVLCLMADHAEYVAEYCY